METLHGPGGPTDNRWPENIRYGTKKENSADQVTAGTWKPPPQVFPCINYGRCGGTARTSGRRCPACVEQAGIQAAARSPAG